MALSKVIDSLPFELAALAGAKNYQSWIFEKIQPFLGRRILEVGAGIGNLAQWLPVGERLVLTEVDPSLLEILRHSVTATHGSHDPRVTILPFDITRDSPALFAQENFDTIVSCNVLEHLEDDQQALAKLLEILHLSSCPGPKKIIQVVPAHPWAFGTIDQTFGHYRRYTKKSLTQLVGQVSSDAQLAIEYFNTLGLLGWFVQGKILKRQSFGVGSVHVFERFFQAIRIVDDFLRRLHLPCGQSLIMVIELSREGPS